ncbi:OmpA family protein [Marinilongibacter aquaticus]|uniref:OmpA/MotB family protein n=1 Tax=Marinilongibacter aquaticus TaxID=2975157 RepID=UPI0021BD2C34|nr:OmpA family protein [Marinilongibacter aquaticus]UBM59070.1 OmpA family protein [Marinilongibacter aquaticus]
MKITTKIAVVLIAAIAFSSCVGKKKYVALQNQLAEAKSSLDQCNNSLQSTKQNLTKAENDLVSERASMAQTAKLREEQIANLKSQVEDLKKLRDQQMQHVGDLTVLSKAANDNIDKTLQQMKQKDQYIHLLQAAKNKADSMNLALAVNLTNSIGVSLDDEDVDIKVDKTVVMVNLSDKMLYRSGSARITARANDVLGKIAKIIKSRPDLEVMVEGHTDNKSIHTDCIEDNWDLSVKRATAVVRVLQENFSVDPSRIIAAGRGEFYPVTTNENSEGRAMNRRTRLILMPKLDQFYDLLDPANAK